MKGWKSGSLEPRKEFFQIRALAPALKGNSKSKPLRGHKWPLFHLGSAGDATPVHPFHDD